MTNHGKNTLTWDTAGISDWPEISIVIGLRIYSFLSQAEESMHAYFAS